MRIYSPWDYNYVKVVEIPKEEISKFDMALCAEPKQSLHAFYNSCEVKPAIVANGGFFSGDDACFNFIDEGIVIAEEQDCFEGIGVINGEVKFGDIRKDKFDDFISAYPVLIKNGKPFDTTTTSHLDYRARRTILAYDAEKVYIIAIESPGMNFAEVKDLLVYLNVEYAVNLDGGGSTKILHNGKSITSSFHNRPVDNVVAVYLKPQTIYRVQVGCFALKKNAEKYALTLGKDAYVRKINGYWKVQVGAFSNRENAVNMVNDLKDKGFNAFIVTN